MRKIAIITGCCLLAPAAMAWHSEINGFGQGDAQIRIWGHPNEPPNSPTHQLHCEFPGSCQLGPNLPGCRPLTQSRHFGTQQWRQQAFFRAQGGDTVDWHSMLPFVTPVSSDAQGFLDVSATITSPTSATYRVDWSGTDQGVAQHIGWFRTPGGPLLRSEMRIGPWSEVIFVTITVPTGFSIMDVVMESSGAAVSLPPDCCRTDYNGDGDIGTDDDIAAFFACLAGDCCATCPANADYNCDGDIGTDDDVASFFRVLTGGTC